MALENQFNPLDIEQRRPWAVIEALRFANAAAGANYHFAQDVFNNLSHYANLIEDALTPREEK